MAELRDALRDFAFQKMRDLEAERAKSKTSKKDDGSGAKSPKTTKIKINRDSSKLISVSLKKNEESKLVQSESKRNVKRSHGNDSESGEGSKIKKLMKLYEEDASVPKVSKEDPAPEGKSVKEQDETRDLRRPGWESVTEEELSKALPQFKGLSFAKKVESGGDVGADKKSVASKGDKKMIKIQIQTKLLDLPQETVKPKEPETITPVRSDSDSNSSSDDDSDDSDDENQVADGLPWRTILEDGELTPTSDDGEEEKEKQDEESVKAEYLGMEKNDKVGDGEIQDSTGEDKKQSSKRKHKSKHKKHKHTKSAKKKKSKHKHKDKKEKSSDLKSDGSKTSQRSSGDKDGSSARNDAVDIKAKKERSSSKRRSIEGKSKDVALEEKKGKRSASSSRKSSEEREAKGTTQKSIPKEESEKDRKTKPEERKEKSRSRHGSRSGSQERSAVKKKRREDSQEKTSEGKDVRKDKELERQEYVEKSKERTSRSDEKTSVGEPSEKSEKRNEVRKNVPVPETVGSCAGDNREMDRLRHTKERTKSPERNDKDIDIKTKPKSPEKDPKLEESKTDTESKNSAANFSEDLIAKFRNRKRESISASEKKVIDEKVVKEEKDQNEDSKKEEHGKEEQNKRDGSQESRRQEDIKVGEKRHKHRGKEKDDKKHRHSKKHQISKVKIDHLEHDFPSDDEDQSDKILSVKKVDVKSEVAVSNEPISETKSASTDSSQVGKKDSNQKSGAPEKEKMKAERKKTPVPSTRSTDTRVSKPSSDVLLATPDKSSDPVAKDTKISASTASVGDVQCAADRKDPKPPSTKKLESPKEPKEIRKMEKEISAGGDNKYGIKIDEVKICEGSEIKKAADIKKEDLSSSEQNKGSTSKTSDDNSAKNVESTVKKKLEEKDSEKSRSKSSKKRKKDKSSDKEEGGIDSDIEEGEIIKKHKKSKKKDKKKDKSEKDKKDRSERDGSERDHKDKKHKRRHSDTHSESRSHSRSHKKRRESRSDDDGDSDISIGKTKMVEKSYFSESRGCWVTRMVPKEDASSSSSGNDDGNEPYDIGDTYIRYPARDRRSVFDRLGRGSRDGRGRYGDRFDRHSRYGYSRRRERSYSRSRSRSRSPKFRIDKKKLLEIAKANAVKRMRAGELPGNLSIPESIQKAADMTLTNESIQKFTDRCKAFANIDGVSSDDESPVNRPIGSDDEDDDGSQKPFVRHPFKVKESAPIVLNIKNAIQIPVASKDNLRVQFPVSSGSQHRKKEEEITTANANDPYGQWTAVEKPEPKPAAASTSKDSTPQTAAATSVATTAAATPATTATTTTPATTPAAPAATPVAAGPHVPGVTNVQPTQPVADKDKVFEDAPEFSYDIGQIVGARLKAARALQSNPNNVEALTVLHHSQKQIQTWAHSSKKPGLFTGSTDATFLRPEEFANPNRKNQAWIKKDMFLTAAPVNTNIGQALMQKMGWKQGEGLGKNKEGDVNPLLLEIKTDRQGLVAAEEKPKKKGEVSKVIRKDLSGKHPVMALNELCNKKRWGKPNFEMVREDGPPHKKNFVFKVCVRNEEYIPTVTCGNKKDAKAMAATVALQRIGLLPS